MPRRTAREDERAARLIAALDDAPKGLLRRDVHRQVFRGGLSAAEIDDLLAALRGRVVEVTELREYTVRRPVRVVRLKARDRT